MNDPPNKYEASSATMARGVHLNICCDRLSSDFVFVGSICDFVLIALTFFYMP